MPAGLLLRLIVIRRRPRLHGWGRSFCHHACYFLCVLALSLRLSRAQSLGLCFRFKILPPRLRSCHRRLRQPSPRGILPPRNCCVQSTGIGNRNSTSACAAVAGAPCRTSRFAGTSRPRGKTPAHRLIAAASLTSSCQTLGKCSPPDAGNFWSLPVPGQPPGLTRCGRRLSQLDALPL